MRHAVAVEQEAFDGSDADRPLTDKGQHRFGEFCDWLLGQGAQPTTVVSSPLLRAQQTAAILAKSAGLKNADILSTELLSPGVNVTELLQYLSDQTGDCIALVGHEPDMSLCLSTLVGGGEFAFGKGFVAAIEFESTWAKGAGRLRWLVGPKLAARR